MTHGITDLTPKTVTGELAKIGSGPCQILLKEADQLNWPFVVADKIIPQEPSFDICVVIKNAFLKEQPFHIAGVVCLPACWN